MQRFLSGAGFALACAALAAGAAQAASHEQHRRAPQNPDAAADATTKSARRLSVTVYNDDLVLVQDVRTLDVPAGRSRIEFPEVSASIHPETASISGKGLAIVEQNFDYDLLTPAKMMEKAVGRQIQVVHTNPATGRETAETATVLSVNAGVVLKIGGRIEALRDDGLPTRVVFGSIPENLRASPTLSVTVDTAQAGPRQVTLSYLATGLSWASDYVGLFDEAGDDGAAGLVHDEEPLRHELQGRRHRAHRGQRQHLGRGADLSSQPGACRSRHRRREHRGAARRLLRLSSAGTPHHRRPADQAGELPRPARLGRVQIL